MKKIFSSIAITLSVLLILSFALPQRNGRPYTAYWSDQIAWFDSVTFTTGMPVTLFTVPLNSSLPKQNGRPAYPYWSDQIAWLDSVIAFGGLPVTDTGAVPIADSTGLWVTITRLHDSLSHKIDTLYRKLGTDSVFASKQGVKRFQFRDSVIINQLFSDTTTYDATRAYVLTNFFFNGLNNFSGVAKLGTINNNSLQFYTNNTQRVQIDSVGRMLIGSGAFAPFTSITMYQIPNDTAIKIINTTKSSAQFTLILDTFGVTKFTTNGTNRAFSLGAPNGAAWNSFAFDQSIFASNEVAIQASSVHSIYPVVSENDTIGSSIKGIWGGLMLGGNGVFMKVGANATADTAILTSGTRTVLTSKIRTGDMIYLTLQNCSSCGILSVGTIVNGTSFVINSSNASDGSIVAWWIIHRK